MTPLTQCPGTHKSTEALLSLGFYYTDDFNEVILYAESNPECSEISTDQVTCTSTISMKSWWPYARIVIFAMVNLSLAVVIYVLFSRAGIIGTQENNISEEDIMDAELAE